MTNWKDALRTAGRIAADATVTAKRERKMGRKVRQQLRSRAQAAGDATVEDYVNRVGAKLAEVARPRMPPGITPAFSQGKTGSFEAPDGKATGAGEARG